MKLSFPRLGSAAVRTGGRSTSLSAPDVPGELVPPPGHTVFLVAHAVGYQTFRCDPKTGQWTLVAPLADLWDDDGLLIGAHFAGPAWEARDGSYVTAARVAGATVDPTALDWQLLRMRAGGSARRGGLLAGTTYVQRVATTGGLPRVASELAAAGEMVEVAYTADYYFWKASVA
jgi:hypothetical protein